MSICRIYTFQKSPFSVYLLSPTYGPESSLFYSDNSLLEKQPTKIGTLFLIFIYFSLLSLPPRLSSAMQPINIDMYLDLSDPYCYLGKKRLENVSRSPSLSLAILPTIGQEQARRHAQHHIPPRMLPPSASPPFLHDSLVYQRPEHPLHRRSPQGVCLALPMPSIPPA